jgi:hypothetical protein
MISPPFMEPHVVDGSGKDHLDRFRIAISKAAHAKRFLSAAPEVVIAY